LPERPPARSPERLPKGSRFAVLASGSGTNLQALLDAYPDELSVVAGDKKGAFAFERARRAGVPVEHVDPAGFLSREDYDRELAERVAAHDVGLVVGAGYMRVLSPAFLERFPAILNVHPSLLPEFRGLNAVGRALAAGVKETGVTVHLMVEEVDAGPIVAQEPVPVLPDDTEERLLERLHPVEHRLLVEAVADYFWGRLRQ
jgi:phosphoribosylglycinamide formyltransferase-1